MEKARIPSQGNGDDSSFGAAVTTTFEDVQSVNENYRKSQQGAVDTPAAGNQGWEALLWVEYCQKTR